jgi:hypothetical protein
MDVNMSEGRLARSTAIAGAERLIPWLVALILIGPTIVYRLEFGLFSISVMEPLVLAAAAGIWWLHRRSLANGQAIRATLADRPIRFVAVALGVLMGWVLLQGLWIDSKTSWLSDIRDWGVPLVAYAVMLICLRRGWQRWTLLVIAVACAQSALAVFQMLTNSFRPFATPMASYKAGFMVDSATQHPEAVSFGLGLFGHPNPLAMYLLTALLLGAGWLWLPGHWPAKVAALLLLALGLASTYSKSSILLAGLIGGVMLAERVVRGNRRLGAAIAGWVAVCSAGVFLVIKLLPNLWLSTFSWRVGLWRTAAGVVEQTPAISVLGAGMDDYARQAVHGQPHNVFVFLILRYGVLGIICLGAIMWRINREAWALRTRGVLARQPLLAVLWLALWGYLLNGLLESTLLDIYGRTFGLLMVTCFLGLRRETLEETADAA